MKPNIHTRRFSNAGCTKSMCCKVGIKVQCLNFYVQRLDGVLTICIIHYQRTVARERNPVSHLHKVAQASLASDTLSQHGQAPLLHQHAYMLVWSYT